MKRIRKIGENSMKATIYKYLITINLILIGFVPGELFALEQNTNRPGGDYHHFSPTSPDVTLCEKMCREGAPYPFPYATSRCKAFTYTKPTTSEPNGICWLKENITPRVEDIRYVSGVVRQNICVHGNSGQIQNKSVNASQYGWGIDYDVVGTGSWLHYSIPTNEADTVIEGLQLRFTITNPKYGWISAIHVYDGNTVLQKFDYQIYGSSLTSEQRTTVDLLLPLSQPFRVRNGVGVSILPQTKSVAGLTKIVNIQIHSVCALVAVAP